MSYWSRDFSGTTETLAETRRYTTASLGDGPGVDLVVLVISELAANAIQHSDSGQPGGRYTVHLSAFADHWRVRVDDAGGLKEPTVSDSDTIDESGRGLILVSELADDWGVFGDHYGRAVWASIPYP